MSMIGHFKHVSSWLLNKMLNEPLLVAPVVMLTITSPNESLDDSGDLPPEVAKQLRDSSAMLRNMSEDSLNQIREICPDDTDWILADLKKPSCCVEKEWHAIHYLLTGSADESDGLLGEVVMGGSQIGEDMDYGPARYLTPEEVREISAELTKVTEQDLRDRYSTSELLENGIYPGGWEDDYIDGIVMYYSQLVSYYQEAAKDRRGMLLFLV